MSASHDDEVGYGKPPEKTRFQPGKSGNPKGRPRAGRSVAVEIRAELKRRVTIRENGKAQTVTKAAALAKQVVAHAISGDMRAFQQLVKLLPKDFALPPDPAATATEPIDAKDAEILERFFARRLSQSSIIETTAVHGAPDGDDNDNRV